MFTFTISTETESSTFSTKEAAQGATQMLEDMKVSFKVVVNTPKNTEFKFSGMNAWAEIAEFFNL